MGRRDLLISAVATLAIALIAGAGGCGDAEPEGAGQKSEPIRLGMLAPLTGRSASSGIAMVKAGQLAVREANDAGGVLGRQVELVQVDDACDPGTAVIGANELIAQDIAVSVGGYCSSATVPTMKIFRSASVPMVIPLSNSTDLLAAGYDSVFLLSGTVVAEARFAAEQIERLGGHRLAVVHDGTSFPLSLADATAKVVRASDKIKLVGKQELTQGAPSYARIADAVLASKADAVYFTGYFTDAHQFVVDLRTRGFAGLIVVGDGATSGPLMAGLSSYLLRDLYGTSFLLPQFMPELGAWSGRYKAAYGDEPPPTTIQAYDAVVLALDAIRRAGSLDRAKILAAIRKTKNVSLLSGPVTFTPEGVTANPRFMLLKVREGGFELVR